MKKIHKKQIEEIWVTIVLTVVAVFVLFFENPVWWILYGLFVGFVLFMTGKDKTKETFLLCFALCYLLTALLISFSPYLRIKDFQLFHPNYEQIEEYTITNSAYKYYSSSTSGGYGYYYAIIDYTYEINGQTIQKTEEDIVKWDSNNDEKLAQIIKSNDFLVFVNQKNPTESKMFYSDDYLYAKGSEGFYLLEHFFWFLVIVLTVLPLGSIILYLYKEKIRGRKNSK